ncbi:acyl-CoA dehydrogenase family protein [Bordetella sp. BOR01]|uniref:acyl-CoA dehydrogenase family protein n=1 Tax=Bordetella sp. BOR01 TaxID=2854779 RepID=UPI001C48DAE8|nr:acyl-CoA dehydrogenase family protein [Bordetella sp. BOR01]MBV7486550.1 acyl-CoA dehydrogenase family protein [Bordetella sp. BOR01]
MTDFLLDDADRAFRAQIKRFLQDELAPRAQAIEDRRDWDAVKAAVRALGSAGYLRLMFADLYQGPLDSPGLTHATILSEEAAYLNYAFETTIATALSCAYPLHRHAAPAVRDRYLPAILDGEAIGAICVTEPNVGSDSAGMETRIDFDATTSEWVINGFKRYISNASVADIYIVYGITNPDVPAQRGMSAVVVPAGQAGLSFPRNYDFMGRRGCIVGEVELRDCRVPADHLLGERDGAFRIMLGMFNFERAILGGSGLGVARSAFDIAVAHAQQREAFGQPLGAKQLIWDWIAEMSWRIDAAELLTYRATKMYDRGVRGKDLMKEAAMAKLVATETANFCADRAVQVLGGDGITKQYGRAEQIYRDARALTIVGGSSEMAKYLIASRALPGIRPNL